MTGSLSDQDLSAQSATLAQLDAPGRVRWGLAHFGEQLVLSTSFGIQSAVMLHLVTREAPGIPVIWIDTGYHFAETYRFADELTKRLELNLQVYQPNMTAARQEALYGKRWEGDAPALEAYNRQNKVEPMNRALSELGATAWMSGLRREQAATRAGLEFLKKQNRTWKLHPILDWDHRTVHRYLTAHDLPYHPFWEEGYVSLGDWHSTSKLLEGMSEEETRFGGTKRECGLHELSGQSDWQI
ncbi:MAG: phosphoadenylyl-sulfate reductase [Opitutales bacterium]